jgi:hypothetical protein
MIKEAVVGLFSKAPNRIVADRYYLRNHGPDVVRISGPWLRGYYSYLAYDPPAEAVARLGAQGGRYTELWFTSMEEWLGRPDLYAATMPPEEWDQEDSPGRQALTMVPGIPTEQFVSEPIDPEKTTVLRWICAIRYPSDVPLAEAEDWYIKVHAEETKQQSGLLRFVSFRSIHELGTPNGGPPTGEAPPDAIRWIRVSELWYRDFTTWHKAVIESPPRYTPPPWGGEYPFVDMVSNFIDLKPDVDFLRGGYYIP